MNCPNCNHEVEYKEENNLFSKELGLESAKELCKENNLPFIDGHIDAFLKCYNCGLYRHSTIIKGKEISHHTSQMTGLIFLIDKLIYKIKKRLKK